MSTKTISEAPAAKTTTTNKIVLTDLLCVRTSDFPFKDEVFLVYTVDGGAPVRVPVQGYQSMAPGDSWHLNIPIDFQNSLKVELFDSEAGNDQFLGHYTYTGPGPWSNPAPITNSQLGDQYFLYSESRS